MADNSGRRVANRLVGEKRSSPVVSKDSTKVTDQDIQLCNRIGCSGRLSSARSTQNLSLDKTKVLKPSSSKCSLSGKVLTVKPSNVAGKVNNTVKQLRRVRTNSLSETTSASSSDAQAAEVATIDQTESQSGESSSMEIGRPSEGPNVRTKRTFSKKLASVAGSDLTSSRISGGSKSTSQLSRPDVSTTRPGSRYLKCSSSPSIAASDSMTSSRKQMFKKRSSEEESSSSSRTKQPTVAKNTPTPTSRNGISISEARQARRSQTSLVDNVNALVRARRSDASTSRRPPHMSQRGSSTDQRMQRSPYTLSATGRPQRTHNTTENWHSRNLINPSEYVSSASLTDHEGFRRYNMNGIEEVLLGLEQIEHDQQISIEQLIALESGMFRNGLNFHDQHRDMRLDIDGMSYEELLALEERMGSVSTALSEEALAKSINKCTYKCKSLDASFSDKNESEDDTKCSICQEEYDIGDEMGSLQCKHSYHIECIDQWLRQKNWCPICKSSADSSSSSS